MAERLIDAEALYPTMDIISEIVEICVDESKRHISSKKAVELIRKCLDKPNVLFSQYRLEEYIDEHPIEAKPVVHAHWEETGMVLGKCSNCGGICPKIEYCGRCGAQMDEEVK